MASLLSVVIVWSNVDGTVSMYGTYKYIHCNCNRLYKNSNMPFDLKLWSSYFSNFKKRTQNIKQGIMANQKISVVIQPCRYDKRALEEKQKGNSNVFAYMCATVILTNNFHNQLSTHVQTTSDNIFIITKPLMAYFNDSDNDNHPKY